MELSYSEFGNGGLKMVQAIRGRLVIRHQSSTRAPKCYEQTNKGKNTNLHPSVISYHIYHYLSLRFFLCQSISLLLALSIYLSPSCSISGHLTFSILYSRLSMLWMEHTWTPVAYYYHDYYSHQRCLVNTHQSLELF